MGLVGEVEIEFLCGRGMMLPRSGSTLPDDETAAAVVRSTALRLIEKRIGRPLSAGERADIAQEIEREPPALERGRGLLLTGGENPLCW